MLSMQCCAAGSRGVGQHSLLSGFMPPLPLAFFPLAEDGSLDGKAGNGKHNGHALQLVDLEGQGGENGAHVAGFKSALPFKPLCMTFQDVRYSVPYPKVRPPAPHTLFAPAQGCSARMHRRCQPQPAPSLRACCAAAGVGRLQCSSRAVVAPDPPIQVAAPSWLPSSPPLSDHLTCCPPHPTSHCPSAGRPPRRDQHRRGRAR